MIRVVLVMLLPVCVRSMVLLSPPDGGYGADEVKEMMKARDAAPVLRVHDDRQVRRGRTGDVLDLPSMDAQPDSPVSLQGDFPWQTSAQYSIRTHAPGGEDVTASTVAESDASDDCVHQGDSDSSDNTSDESESGSSPEEKEDAWDDVVGVGAQLADLTVRPSTKLDKLGTLGAAGGALNLHALPSPMTDRPLSAVTQKLNHVGAEPPGVNTAGGSWGLNHGKHVREKEETDEEEDAVIIEEFTRLAKTSSDSFQMSESLHGTNDLVEMGNDTPSLPATEHEFKDWRRKNSAAKADPSLPFTTSGLPGGRQKRSVATRRGGSQQGTSSDARGRARVGSGEHAALKANVEVLAVVENSIYRKFLVRESNNREVALTRMRRYYGIVFAMIAQRFQTLDSPEFSIGVKMSGLLIAETREDSFWLEQLVDWSTVKKQGRASVNTDKVLASFRNWTKSQLSFLPKFDHAMLFAGYRLTNRDGRVHLGGKAYLGTICDVENGNSVSVVSDNGDFQCVKVATHELGHSLGAVHDGERGAEQCHTKGNYIMATIASQEPQKLRNAFYFSPCSIHQMYITLGAKKADCVRDKPNVFYNYDLNRTPPGLVISLDQSCQLIYGPKASFCRQDKEMINVMCGQLWCRDPDLANACRTNSYLTALPGTRCGDGKSCHLGECLPDSVIRQRIDDRRDSLYRYAQASQETPAGAQLGSPTQLQSTSDRGHGSASPDPSLGTSNVIPSLPRSVISGTVGRLHRPAAGQPRRQPPTVRTERRRHTKLRRKGTGRCQADQPDTNVDYCRGLATLNPGACKRRDVRNYCCRTCFFQR